MFFFFCNLELTMSAETISRSSVCLDSPLKVGAKDQLNMEEYHQSLIKFIEDARDDDDTPITIALQGEWGSGKTSIMNILKAELCEGENAKFYSVNINAWKFCMLDSTSKSAPSQAVVNILQSMIYQIMAFKPNNMQRERVDLILNKIAAAMSNAKSIYDVIGEPLLSQAGVNKTVVGFVGKAINTLKSAGSKEEKKSTDNISLVEQLHKEVEDIVEDILSTKYNQKQEQKHVLPHKDRDNQKNNTDQSYLQKKPISLINIKSVPYVISFRICVFLVNILFYVLDLAILIACQMFMFLVEFTSNFLLLLWRIFYYLLSIVFDFCIYIKEQLCSIGTEYNPQKTSKYKKESTTDSNNTNKRGFIFFIDDLDRIQPELALEILEILKNLFDIKHCIFIIAIDPVVLNEAITKKLGVLTFNDLYKFQCYLNKLIQITFPAPIAFYDIIPMLKNELIKISYFNEDDLKSQDLLEFLKSAIKESINNNPRLFKTIVNKLSLANILNNKLNERKGSESVFGLFEKKLTFVLICIVVGFPDVFTVISRFPYLRGWNDELAKACYLGPADNNLLLQLKLLKGIDLKGQNQHASWEFILFRMCQYNDCKNGFDNFEKVLKLLRLIDQMCFDEVDGNLDEYKNLMIKFFKLAKGHPLSDDLS